MLNEKVDLSPTYKKMPPICTKTKNILRLRTNSQTNTRNPANANAIHEMEC